MPTFDTSTPRISRKFSGIDFSVPAPYTSGHVLTDAEAKWVNSVLASVVGNAYSGDIRRAVEAHNKANPKKPITVADLDWDHQAQFEGKFADYTLGESNRGEGRAAADPVSSLARTFASMELKRRLIAKGHKVRAVQTAKNAEGVSKFEELLTILMERDGETFRAQAQAQLDAMKTLDADTDDLLAGVDLPDEAEAA